MSAEKDIQAVYVASQAAGHGLMQFFVKHPGIAYVLGDNHYVGLRLRTSISVDTRDITPTEDRKTLIRELQKKPDYEGVIPVTPAFLDDVTELGMRKIAQGLIVENIPPIPDGTHFDVYK